MIASSTACARAAAGGASAASRLLLRPRVVGGAASSSSSSSAAAAPSAARTANHRLRTFSSSSGGGGGGGGGSRIPVRRDVTKAERAQLRAARKERAAAELARSSGGGETAAGAGAAAAGEGAAASASGASASASSASSAKSLTRNARLLYGAGVGVPTALLAWGIYDEESPPAKLAEFVGLTGRIKGVTDEFARPVRAKLLPDWSQMPNVPQDIPTPHTLVLDLENTLVSSTWDRKYGWRHAKRPGVDKFLHEMAQYYEIVLYSPSHEGVAAPVVDSLDKSGCIMHRLYREATWYVNGTHAKDLNSLNRNTNRMILLDDDPNAAQLNPENLIRVKPYTDPTDREDRTLSRITPLLVEIAREGYDDVPSVLRQFGGMDADEIADELESRVSNVRQTRERRARRGLGSFTAAGGRAGVGGWGASALPEPELSPVPEDTRGAPGQPPAPGQGGILSSKDIVGAAPESEKSQGGVIGWFNRRQKENEEEQMRKLEKWNEHMMSKAKEREERAKAAQAGA